MSACLDAFAILCWLQDDPGAALVEELLAVHSEEPDAWPVISAINLGEVFYRLARSQNLEAAQRFWREAHRGEIPVRPVAASRSRVLAAARLKARYRIGYADAFAIELAFDRSLPLVTGDPEMKAVEGQEALEIRWLPKK